jgi:hypothetical protein
LELNTEKVYGKTNQTATLPELIGI